MTIDDLNNLPRHIAIIMDGNGTWATNKGISRLKGHRAGVESLRNAVEYIKKFNKIECLTVYAFSTENWNRDAIEVNGLMDMLREYLQGKDIDKLNEEDVKVRILGNREDSRIPADIINIINDVEEKTKNNKKFNFNIAFNYGGRTEIVETIKKLSEEDIKSLTVDKFSNKLYTFDIPDPDLIIRTSGEKRISNFLLWQAAYSELYFTDVLWPDFDEKNINKALQDYSRRKRKFGKV